MQVSSKGRFLPLRIEAVKASARETGIEESFRSVPLTAIANPFKAAHDRIAGSIFAQISIAQIVTPKLHAKTRIPTILGLGESPRALISPPAVKASNTTKIAIAMTRLENDGFGSLSCFKAFISYLLNCAVAKFGKGKGSVTENRGRRSSLLSFRESLTRQSRICDLL
jgi:hypothetical protein